ncbi:MAG: hypothetical protein JNM61_12490 [Zoogloeaceae bacterium]|nr:hypothetical protein [Zoogloeaceae bacterium]
MSRDDLLRLRWPIIAAVVMALAGGYLVWLAQIRHEAREALLARLASEYRRTHGRLLQAQGEEAQIREAIGRFRRLEDRGVVGPEHRLDWVERLAAVRQRLNLPALEYELRPRQPLDPAAASARLRVTRSAMEVSATVLHEEDLLGLLAGLQAEPSAIVRPTECRLARPTSGQGGLSAHCALDWITLEQEGS